MLREQNELLREQVAAFKKERSENTLSYKELVYIQRCLAISDSVIVERKRRAASATPISACT